MMGKESVKSLDVFSSLSVLYRYRKFLLVSHLVVGVVALVISLVLEKTYKSTATILVNPPEQVMGIPSDLQNMIPLNLFGGGDTNIDQFLAILNSSSMADSIIKKFDLYRVYDVKYKKQAHKKLRSNIGIIDNDDGTITFHVSYKGSPEKSTEMADYMLDLLNRINLKLTNERSRNSRLFLELEYGEIKDALKDSENRLAELQRKYGIVELTEQVKASISLLGEIETERMLSKIQYDYLSTLYSDDHPTVVNIKKQLESYDKEIALLTTEFNKSSIVLPIQKVPDLGVEYLGAMREFTINEALFEFITPVYEKTKLDEVKNVPNFVVLDYPVVPDYKDSPKRALIVIVTVLLFAILTVFVILLREYYRINRAVFNQIFTGDRADS